MPSPSPLAFPTAECDVVGGLFNPKGKNFKVLNSTFKFTTAGRTALQRLLNGKCGSAVLALSGNTAVLNPSANTQITVGFQLSVCCVGGTGASATSCCPTLGTPVSPRTLSSCGASVAVCDACQQYYSGKKCGKPNTKARDVFTDYPTTCRAQPLSRLLNDKSKTKCGKATGACCADGFCCNPGGQCVKANLKASVCQVSKNCQAGFGTCVQTIRA